MLDHAWQVPVKQGLAAIQADVLDAALLGVVEQVADLIPAELGAPHEVAAVTTADAAQVALGRQRDVERARLWLDDLGNHARDGVPHEVDLGIQRQDTFVQSRVASEEGPAKVREPGSKSSRGRGGGWRLLCRSGILTGSEIVS